MRMQCYKEGIQVTEEKKNEKKRQEIHKNLRLILNDECTDTVAATNHFN